VSSAAFFNDLTIASAWATCQDIGRRYAAVTAACMNTAGAIGAAIAGWLTGTLLERSLASHAAETARTVAEFSPTEKHAALLDGYHASFLTYASVYVLSALCWLVIDASKPLEQDDKPALPE
jgi:hypothetical protein